MKLDLLYEIDAPKPWQGPHPYGQRKAEQKAYREAVEQIKLADAVGFNTIWAVTDFHVPDQPGSFGHGIDAERLGGWLSALTLGEKLTYHFHDTRWKLLTNQQRSQETAWLRDRDQHGRQLATAWLRA